jgi:hypothetical protein
MEMGRAYSHGYEKEGNRKMCRRTEGENNGCRICVGIKVKCDKRKKKEYKLTHK